MRSTFWVYAIALMLFSLLSSSICLAAKADLDVTWDATGSPGFVKISGEGGKATCELSVSTGEGDCQCELDAFDTGIDLRNKHMREKYLETKKWPKAFLHIDKAVNGIFQGKLTLKGKSKPVSGKFSFKDDLVDAIFTISLDDYKVGVPSYLGVSVAKDVAIRVQGKVK